MLASEFPVHKEISYVRKLPSQREVLLTSSAMDEKGSESQNDTYVFSSPKNAPTKPSLLKAQAKELYALHVTLDAEAHNLLQETKDLLGHKIPQGDLNAVLKEALKIAATALRARKFSIRKNGNAYVNRTATVTERPLAHAHDPSALSKKPRTRPIPHAIKREVYERDGGCCTFASQEGHHCRETRQLEYHHKIAYAQGGMHTLENIVLMCRTHNVYFAERDFGKATILEKIMQNKNHEHPKSHPLKSCSA